MKLKVTREMETGAVIERFMDHFDGLKIEFFHHSHANEEGSPKKDMVRSSMPLGALSPDLEEKEVIIDPGLKVREVEELFEKQFGLHIQVFRKMNISWIETTATDSYTLEHQVQMSRESRGMN